MEMFSKDELGLIALELDIESLSNFCQTSKYINSKVGMNNDFWANKLKKDFDIDFFRDQEIIIPNSCSLREDYLKSVPAKAEYFKYSKFVKYVPAHMLGVGIKKNSLAIIKIALSRDATYQTEFFRDMIEMENYKNILNISMDCWANRLENVIKIIADMYPIINFAEKKDKAKLGLILFDIVLPRSVKFLKESKNFWVNVYIKFNEFKDIFPELREVYDRRVQLYKFLAEI
jgi:hypothetical protein